jgi:hypothetical protein
MEKATDTATKFETGTWAVWDTIDTRDYDFIDGAWRAVAGSGEYRECDICGREHAVWVIVRCKETKETATVGCTCAKRQAKALRNFRVYDRCAKSMHTRKIDVHGYNRVMAALERIEA